MITLLRVQIYKYISYLTKYMRQKNSKWNRIMTFCSIYHNNIVYYAHYLHNTGKSIAIEVHRSASIR